MQTLTTAVSAIFVFGLLILAHELGHYLAARLSGVRVLELAIGFGPKLLGWRKNKTDYSLRIFPLGGFCRMLGESPDDEPAPDSFTKKPLHLRAAVLAAGSLMNLLLAVTVFFVIFFFLMGLQSTRLETVMPGSPAQRAGLAPGDQIVAINGIKMNSWEDIVTEVSQKPGEEITVVVKRNGEIKDFTLIPEPDPESGRGLIGITSAWEKYQFKASLRTSLDSFAMVIRSMYQVISGRAPLDVTGPVGIIMVVNEVAQTGFINLLWLTGLISISLGLINLLPLPALDGGRLLFLLIEALRGKPLDPEKEGFVHFVGFALLLVLLLLVTYNDLIRWEILPGR